MRTSPPSSESTPTGGRRRVRGAALVGVAVSALCLGTLTAVPAQAATTTIDILGINDFHGRLAQEASPTAGAAVMAGKVNEFRAANPNTLFVSSGDNIGASTFTSFIQDDEPTLDALNAMGLDVSTPGNHEFDKGQDDFNGRVTANSEFPYVNANIYETSTGERAYDPYFVKDVDGVRVGFVGAITELMPELVSPAGVEGLEFRDIVDSVNDAAAELTDGVETDANGEADVIVLLVHEGNASAAGADATGDSQFADIAKNVSPSVDAILSAHTHQTYNFTDIVPTGGTKPRPVVQTGSYGANLSHLVVQYDDVTGEATVTSSLVPLYQSASPDPTVAAIVTNAEAVAAVEGRRPVGTITGDLLRAKQLDGSENRGGESTLGNLVADAQLAATVENGAQIAFMNPGGLRADLRYASTGDATVDADGRVTFQEAAAVQPFANTLVVSTLTGAQIRQTLEQQWQPAGSSRPFLKLGVSEGLTYTYDPTAAAGSRIGDITFEGAPLDEAASYKVTVNSFLASGGDNFTALNGASAKADSGKVDLQSQVDYFAANPSVSPDLAQRAVGVTAPVAPEGGYEASDTVEYSLSSLLFSNGGPTTGTVTATLDGVEVGSATIDGTVVSTTDEQGRAALTVTIPEIAAGTAAQTRQLLFTVTGTGTTFTAPVSLAAVAAAPVDPTDPGTTPPVTTPGGTVPGTTPGTGTGSGSTPAGTVRNADGSLAFTGQDGLGLGALAALALMLAGGSALVVGRRRRLRATASSTED
jgi:5'-nucleotidase